MLSATRFRNTVSDSRMVTPADREINTYKSPSDYVYSIAFARVRYIILLAVVVTVVLVLVVVAIAVFVALGYI